MSRRSSLAFLALLVVGCSSARPASQGVGSSPALEPVETWMVTRGGEGNDILFRNNTRGQIRITSIRLLSCQNTSPSCRTVDPQLVLDPGQVREGLTVRPVDPREGFSFYYRYTWEPVGPAAPGASPGRGNVTENVVVSAASLMPAQAQALGARFVGIRARADSVVMRVGQMFDLNSIEVLAVDSAGTSLGRLSIFDTGVTPGAIVSTSPMRLAAVMPGVSILTIRVSSPWWSDTTRPRPETHVRFVVH